MYILSGKKRYDDNNVETGTTYKLKGDHDTISVVTGQRNTIYMAGQELVYDNSDDAMADFMKIVDVASDKHGVANISDLELEKPKPKRAPRKKAEPKVEEEAKE